MCVCFLYIRINVYNIYIKMCFLCIHVDIHVYHVNLHCFFLYFFRYFFYFLERNRFVYHVNLHCLHIYICIHIHMNTHSLKSQCPIRMCSLCSVCTVYYWDIYIYWVHVHNIHTSMPY